ncbi:MAG: hypothetical protein HOI95_25010 [Chromatiales bacterium]|nr:hypothetical protein [Chromatiales bacterium]
MGAIKLTLDDRAQYERDGYLVLRNYLADDELGRLSTAIDSHLPHDAYAPGCTYPQAAKYTLSEQSAEDSDFAYIIEHPKVYGPAEQLLGGPAHLTAYVIYVRTPGDPGSLPHNDYKRWRPVGSSMNWLFTVVPLTDFDEETGQLLVVPGSHQLNLVEDRGEKTLHRGAPLRPDESQFVDARLRRGDLLLMNMYTWHWAPPNRSGRDRIGLFNKYAAVNAPPAAGYFVNTAAVKDALTPAGRRLIAVGTDQRITTTRALCTRPGDDGGTQVLTVRKQGKSDWQLPGGEGSEETVIPGWDVGNRIASLGSHMLDQVGADCPWMSYVGDYEEQDGLCRVYGYTAPESPAFQAANGYDMRWTPVADSSELTTPYVAQAVERWTDPEVTWGKGLTQAQSKVDQYAL